MRRKGLPVVLRLAQIEERRALQRLGAARARSAELEARLAELEAQGSQARAAMALGAGQSAAAELLRQHAARLAGATWLARGVTENLVGARAAESSLRDAFARRRLRVRVVAKAIERRAARARRVALRRESQRIDEAVRGARARQEADDALA
jgi:flagellar export protein FliJ